MKNPVPSTVTPEGAAIIDMTQNPTRADVAEMFGVTVQAVRKWEKQGKLRSMNDAEGTARFAMSEVQALQVERDGGIQPSNEFEADDEDESRIRSNYGGFPPRLGMGGGLGMLPTDATSLELSVVGKLLNLLVKPRERIDDLQFRLLEAAYRRITELETRVNEMTDAVQKAEDRTADREAAAMQIKASEARTTGILNRLMGTFDKLVNKGGTPFLHSLEIGQLEALLEAPEAWTPAQLEAMRKVIEEKKLAVNGVNSKGSITTEGATAS